MNRDLASAMAIGATAAAAVAFATLVPAKAHAGDITIDNTPFVSSKSRSEVRAHAMPTRVTTNAVMGGPAR